MDPDVLGHVLGRVVDRDTLRPAILHGFQRVASPGVVYPRLVANASARVPGLAMRSPSARDVIRLSWFEDGEYDLTTADIRLLDGRIESARLFRAMDAVLPAGSSPWCPMTWTVRHKQSYLEQCFDWMKDCPEPDMDHPFVRATLGQALKAA